jgi:hypothetical protein
MGIRAAILERDDLLQGLTGPAISDATPDVLARAGKIAAGAIYFYGRTEVPIGLRGIDWTGSHLKHQEWPAQLNRFYHLPPLAAAYRSTKDERFAHAARSYIEDWISTHPGYETAERFMPGDSGLNMSARLGTSHSHGWAGVIPTFLASPAFDDAFLMQMLDSMSIQAAFLADHLTPWGNWRISELDALVFTALRFPFLENAPELLSRGIEGMRSALATQFLPDGVHIERCPGYHEWMAGVLADYYLLARRFPECDAKVDPEMVVRAFDYAAHDELFGVNDSRAPHRDPDALGHLENREAVLARLFPGKEIPVSPPLEQAFTHAGHVFLRSSWKPGADYLAFDAGTWGGGHGHLSRLSFVFRSAGRALVADPGILNYEMSDPLAPYGKSTRAHSTLSLNGRNQCEADADLLRTDFTADTALIHAKYQGGYWQGEFYWGFDHGRGTGIFGIHERILFWVKGEYLLALDSIDADRGATVHNCWQMGPMDAWSMDQEALTWWSRNSDSNILVRCIPFVENAEMECFEGSRDPIRGWVGLHGNDAIPAPLVEFRYPSGISAGSPSAVLLAAFTGDAPPHYDVKRKSQAGRGRIRHLELALPSGGADLLSWSKELNSPVEDGSPITSDAFFVWLRLDASGKPAKCFLLDGSYLEYERRLFHESASRQSTLVRFDL